MRKVVCLVFFYIVSCRSTLQHDGKIAMPAWTIAPGGQPNDYFVRSNLLPPYTKINVADLNLSLRVLEETESMSGEYIKADLSNIDCSFYSSSGTLFGKIKYPPLLNATIMENKIMLRFSESQFNEYNSPAKYQESSIRKSNLKIAPADARVFRISHFCEGYGTGFTRANRKGAGYLIFFADRPLTLTGEVDFGNDEKGIVNIAINQPGFNFIGITKTENIYHFALSEKYDDIAFGLSKGNK
jgi:hypothetical protein